MLFLSAAPPAPVVFQGWPAVSLVGAVAVTFLAIGGLIIRGRTRIKLGTTDTATSFVRSWLGLGLIVGLLLSCTASLALNDDTLRSTLFGGLIASAGAASAFYFASTGSDQARQDILTASGTRPTVLVPDLTNMTLDQARPLLTKLQLKLEVDPADAPDTATITGTEPAAASLARVGDTVTAHT